MAQLPQDLDEAIAQAREATQAALTAGCTRLQIELIFPELKPMPVAQQFVSVFADWGSQLQVFFPDAGAAALAKRDWGEVPFRIRDIGELREPIQVDGEAFLIVAPTSAEVVKVEKLATAAGDRPFVLLNPRLEDLANVGLGYAGRQLRDRFLGTFETGYYLRPLEQAALLRCYPEPWQVWQETERDYELLAEVDHKPMGDELEEIFAGTSGEAASSPQGLLTGLQRFLRALTQ